MSAPEPLPSTREELEALIEKVVLRVLLAREDAMEDMEAEKPPVRWSQQSSPWSNLSSFGSDP